MKFFQKLDRTLSIKHCSFLMNVYIKNFAAVIRRSNSQLFFKLLFKKMQHLQKNTCKDVFTSNFTKMLFWGRYHPANFSKFFRIAYLWNISNYYCNSINSILIWTCSATSTLLLKCKESNLNNKIVSFLNRSSNVRNMTVK